MGAVLQGFRVVPIAIVVQALIAFLIPLGAGFFPVNKGAKTNVRRAISNYRPEQSIASRIVQPQRRMAALDFSPDSALFPQYLSQKRSSDSDHLYAYRCGCCFYRGLQCTRFHEQCDGSTDAALFG